MPIPDFMDIDAYLLEIEERADALLNKIRGMNLRDGSISIFDILKDQLFFEIVRAFMMLLFLAQKGEIDLLQDEDESDIRIITKESDKK
jgi:chromatin segregation and condensation protein Rec8/ScpA/Scc1 (kleisin family)